MKRLMVLAVSVPIGLQFISSEALAQAPTVSQTISVLQNDSANSGNFATGAILYERATVTGVTSTSDIFGFLRQGTTGIAVFTQSEPVNPGWVAASVPYNSALTGSWTFHLSTTPTFTTSNNHIS